MNAKAKQNRAGGPAVTQDRGFVLCGEGGLGKAMAEEQKPPEGRVDLGGKMLSDRVKRHSRKRIRRNTQVESVYIQRLLMGSQMR